MEVVNEGHSERATLENLGPLELLGMDENNIILLENVSDQEAGLFFSQPLEIQITGDQPPTINENVETLQYQELEVPVHEISSVVSSNSNFNSDSDEQYQPPSSNSTASIESDDSIRVASVLQAENNEQSATEETASKRKKRRGKRNGNEYKRQKNAEMRLFGKSYVGFKKDASGKYKQIKQIDEKKIGPRCRGHTRMKKGGPRQSFFCDQINDEERSRLFSEFWALPNWDSKKTYIKNNVLHSEPKYKRNDSIDVSRKKTTFRFYFSMSDGNRGKVKKQVCKQMFMHTISIGERPLRDWVKPPETSSSQSSTSVENISASENAIIELKEWLNSLAKVESHYCRASSDKLYLEPVWGSMRDFYRKYVSIFEGLGKTKVSRTTLKKIMDNMNLAFYTPKKDQCNECTMHGAGTLDKESYAKHIKKKQEAIAEKEADKSKALKNSGEVRSYTVDLQAVLLAPRLNAAANYYKTKLKVHNQVYYNLSSKDVSCYVWHEGNGGLDSDVFASIATKFISNELAQAQTIPQKIVIWSDGCGYQNRNTKLSNALLDLSMKYRLIIEQKYLEVGHTHMEVDGCHSAIETKLKHRKQVFLPADYIPIIQSARPDQPFKTYYLSYNDFEEFNSDYYTSIRPGYKAGDPCVNDLVALQYTPEKVINYKLAFSDDWAPLPCRPRRSISHSTIRPKLYDRPCPIERSKFEHLQELKKLIPEDYRNFYETLPHKKYAN